jgi:hypothetical protein
MAFVSLPEMSCWGNSHAQRVCPSPVCLRLIQRHFPPKSRFLGVANAMIEASIFTGLEKNTIAEPCERHVPDEP